MITTDDIERFFEEGNTVGNAMHDITDLDTANEVMENDKDSGMDSMKILVWCMTRAAKSFAMFEEKQKELPGLASMIPAEVAFAGSGMFSMFRVGYYLGRAEEAEQRANSNSE